MYKHLFVLIDGSDLSKRAMYGSIVLAKRSGARITGFIAEPEIGLSTVNPDPGVFTERMGEHERKNELHATAVLKHFEGRAQTIGVPFFGRHLTTAGVDTAIVSDVEQAGCDLIVMITHGRGPVGELLFGSHAKHTIPLTKLPMLVLH